MKYLQDEQLARWTSALTGVPIGQSRILHGRLEAYSMKRASSDKKYAAVLGEKYVEQIHQDQEWAATMTMMPRLKGRKRSQSAGILEECLATAPPPTKRPRSCSLDGAAAAAAVLSKSVTALGDFNEQGTRRLMTDLVLTLNASFSDYDFSSTKPTDFTKMPLQEALSRMNESLSEWAASSSEGDGSRHNLNEMWEAVDQCVSLKQCDVYKFTPSEDASFLLAADVAMISSTDDEVDDDYYDDNYYYYPHHSAGYDKSDFESQGGRRRNSNNDGPASSVLWSFYFLFVNKHLKRIVLFSCAESMRHMTARISPTNYDDENDVVRFIPFSDAETNDNLDFDLDPESIPAGGIPFSTTMA